jgi:hypothetical protein
MKCNGSLLTVIAILLVALLPLSSGPLNAREADSASTTFAAAQTAKQKCVDVCRSRNRNCFSLKQIPSFECRGVYRDCVRYTCTGLGPG